MFEGRVQDFEGVYLATSEVYTSTRMYITDYRSEGRVQDFPHCMYVPHSVSTDIM